jgi:hypothetical protein
MPVILHIGAHKTGTSLVQKYFRDRAGDFVNSRVTAVSRSDTNRLIGWGEVLLEKPGRIRRRIEAEQRSEPDAIVISHENTLGRPFVDGRSAVYPDAAELSKALAAAVDGIDARAVFYVRPMADFVESYYLQTVHEGAWHSFEEWFETVDLEQLTWTPVIEAIEDAFGASNTVIGDFTEVKEGQEEFLRRFMVRTQVPLPPKVHYKPRRNASVSQVGLEIARSINPHLQTREQRSATRKFLQEHFSNATGERARPMPPDVRAEIERRTADEYAALAARSLESVGA